MGERKLRRVYRWYVRVREANEWRRVHFERIADAKRFRAAMRMTAGVSATGPHAAGEKVSK